MTKQHVQDVKNLVDGTVIVLDNNQWLTVTNDTITFHDGVNDHEISRTNVCLYMHPLVHAAMAVKPETMLYEQLGGTAMGSSIAAATGMPALVIDGISELEAKALAAMLMDAPLPNIQDLAKMMKAYIADDGPDEPCACDFNMLEEAVAYANVEARRLWHGLGGEHGGMNRESETKQEENEEPPIGYDVDLTTEDLDADLRVFVVAYTDKRSEMHHISHFSYTNGYDAVAVSAIYKLKRGDVMRLETVNGSNTLNFVRTIKRTV